MFVDAKYSNFFVGVRSMWDEWWTYDGISGESVFVVPSDGCVHSIPVWLVVGWGSAVNVIPQSPTPAVSLMVKNLVNSPALIE